MNRKQLVESALNEDIPTTDITTECLGTLEFQGRAQLVAKEDLVLSGQDFFTETIKQLDPLSKLNWLYKDGDVILNKQCVCIIDGNLIKVLQAERVALNFLGHLSGIATYTKLFADQVSHTKTQILDTRKTMPNLRIFEKQAVKDGGASNHRMSLSDEVLIKENHIRIAGSLTAAVHKAKEKLPGKTIEVEVTNIEDVKTAVEAGAHRLLLDNMNNNQLREALSLIPENIKTEASGNMSLERVKSVAETGVDYISVGALTHSSPCADLSLLFDWSL